MKFKEELNKNEVVYRDEIGKHFDKKTVETFVELEKTIQTFWNVDRDSANFLNMLIKIKGVKSALEIGTSNGYSAIWLAHALKQTGGRLIAVEFWEKRMEMAVENFKETGVENLIMPVVGDAVEILREMNKKGAPKFDFVFMDANKAEYIEYFRLLEPLIEDGGVIVADNILSHHKKVKDYVEEIMSKKGWQSQLLNFEAGMMLSFKVGEN